MARRLTLLLLLAAGCAGAPVERDGRPDGPPPPPRPAPVHLSPEGSRISLALPPGMDRVAHALRWRGEGIDLHVADAQVPEGEERGIAEGYLARLSERYEGELSHRPVGIAGVHGYEVTIRGASRRVRAITLWRGGAISRVTVVHDPSRAADVERVIDSVRFDPTGRIDPVAALQIQAAVPEGLGLLPVTNEQLVFRRLDEEGRAARAVAFPHPEPSLDVAVVAFPDGGRPPNDVARGRLLGSRFAGLELGTPRMVAVSGELSGFAIVSTAPVEGTELTLYGAYLEGEDAVVLVRASVATEDAEEWLPRFGRFTLSIGLDG